MTHWLTIIQVYAFICLGGLYCLVGLTIFFVCVLHWVGFSFVWLVVFFIFIIGGAFGLLGGSA